MTPSSATVLRDTTQPSSCCAFLLLSLVTTTLLRSMSTARGESIEQPRRVSLAIGNDAEKMDLEGEDADALKLQALGHKQEMKRNFSVWSIAAMGFVNGK